MNNNQVTITELLRDKNAQDLNKIMDLAYGRLMQIAKSLLRREPSGHTLQTGGLVHEAYMRFLNLDRMQWRDRSHFYAVWTGIMRRVLIDHARGHKAAKRGGHAAMVTFDDQIADPHNAVDILALDEALTRLAAVDTTQCDVVALRFFGGLSVEEAAHTLNISPATVKRKWTVAQAWLYRELNTQTHATQH